MQEENLLGWKEWHYKMSFELVDLKVILGYPGGLVKLATGYWYLVKQSWEFQVCKQSHENTRSLYPMRDLHMNVHGSPVQKKIGNNPNVHQQVN